MSEMLLVKSVATAAAIGTFTLAGIATERLLRRFQTATIRRAALSCALAAVVALGLLLVINPARWPDPAVKVIGDLLAFGTIAAFVIAVLLGFTLKARR